MPGTPSRNSGPTSGQSQLPPGPKRHPDFMKQSHSNEPYSPYSNSQSPSPYPNYPNSGRPGSTNAASPGPWPRDGGNAPSANSRYIHPSFPPNGREPWSSNERASSSAPDPSWPGQAGSSNRYGQGFDSREYPNNPSGRTSPVQSQNSMVAAHYPNSKMASGSYRTSAEQSSRAPYGQPIPPTSGHHMPTKQPHTASGSSHYPSHGSAYGPYGVQQHHSGATSGPMPPHMAAAVAAHHSQHQAMASVSGHFPHPHKREHLFPPNSVEATVPSMIKRRKINARDILPVEAWRVYMALKSGLLAESTFALDALNVYSNDDSTLMYLSFSNMPGLLELLIEHYKAYLNEMFDNMFDDTEIGFDIKNDDSCCDKQRDISLLKGATTKPKSNSKLKPRKWFQLTKDRSCSPDRDSAICDDEPNSGEELTSPDKLVPDKSVDSFFQRQFKAITPQQVVLFNSTNYTHVTRNGKPVKYEKKKSLFIEDYDKEWDQIKNGFETGHEHWARGGGETTSHIQSHIEPKESYLRFVRFIQNGKDKSENGEDSNTETCTNNENPLESEESDDEEKERKRLIFAENHYPKIRDSDRERYWSQTYQPEYEDESYDLESSAISIGRDYQDSIKSRCLTVSNLLRNLTFVPGNEVEMGKHSGLMLILSRLILLNHSHEIKPKRKSKSKLSSEKEDDEDSSLFNENKSKSESSKESGTVPDIEQEWWSDALHIIRENTLVTLANLSGHLDLSSFPELIALNILDGLLHWAVCPSSYAEDALPSAHPTLSPRRLAYEALSKLSIFEFNVDLILATPPWSRMQKFFSNLSRSLGRHEDQTIREFAIVLLSNFSSVETATARAIALIHNTIPLLISFIEVAEQCAMRVVASHGIHMLRENPELMGTTLDMIRRTAIILRNLARVSENRSLFIQHEQRLLALVMSQMLDQGVSSIIADILYECSKLRPSKVKPDAAGLNNSVAFFDSTGSHQVHTSLFSFAFKPRKPTYGPLSASNPAPQMIAPAENISSEAIADSMSTNSASSSIPKEILPDEKLQEKSLKTEDAVESQNITEEAKENFRKDDELSTKESSPTNTSVASDKPSKITETNSQVESIAKTSTNGTLPENEQNAMNICDRSKAVDSEHHTLKNSPVNLNHEDDDGEETENDNSMDVDDVQPKLNDTAQQNGSSKKDVSESSTDNSDCSKSDDSKVEETRLSVPTIPNGIGNSDDALSKKLADPTKDETQNQNGSISNENESKPSDAEQSSNSSDKLFSGTENDHRAKSPPGEAGPVKDVPYPPMYAQPQSMHEHMMAFGQYRNAYASHYLAPDVKSMGHETSNANSYNGPPDYAPIGSYVNATNSGIPGQPPMVPMGNPYGQPIPPYHHLHHLSGMAHPYAHHPYANYHMPPPHLQPAHHSPMGTPMPPLNPGQYYNQKAHQPTLPSNGVDTKKVPHDKSESNSISDNHGTVQQQAPPPSAKSCAPIEASN